MAETGTLICCKCRKELKPRKTVFVYLGHEFFAEIPACPECGQVYISVEMAKGRIAEVEAQLEDK